MENDLFVILFLAALVIFQQVWYGYQIQILLNKLMSRNYSEYELSKPEKSDSLNIKLPKSDPGAQQDLDYLTGFNR